MRERIALFAGTFDPFTVGHQDIALRMLEMFDRVVVGIGINDCKKTLFPLESRLQIIRDTFSGEPRLKVGHYDDLTINYCRRIGAQFMVRGLRSGTDFDYERTIAQANFMVDPEVETIFLVTRKEHAPITSTVVRDLLLHNGNVTPFLPVGIDITRYKRNEW